MPPKPPLGFVIWKVNSVCGKPMKTFPAASAKVEVCSIVAFEDAFTMPKMTPWSSVGRELLGGEARKSRNMIAAMMESPIQAV